MPLDVLRRLGFDGPITGFVRDSPRLLREPYPVTGVHLQFDSAFLRRMSQAVDAGFRVAPRQQPSSLEALIRTLRQQRREAVEYSVENFGTGDDIVLERLLGWPERCAEMGYDEKAKPVVIVIDYGQKAERGWLAELPRQYAGFPIRYRFSPPAQAQLGPGSIASGADVGTLGGVLEDSVTHRLYGMTCAHVAGGNNASVDEIDNKGNVIATMGQVVDSTLPAAGAGRCNAHAQPKAGLDVALIDLGNAPSVQVATALSTAPIANVDQDDPVAFVGGRSGTVTARVAAATLWKQVDIAGQTHCFGDLFAIGHRQPAYVLQAVSQGGDSGTWIFEDPPTQSANTHWLGMLIAGDRQQNQTLACYGEHLFAWARQGLPNLVLPP